MRKRDANRLTMLGVLIDFCEKNSSAWSGIPLFGAKLNAVKAKKAEIEQYHLRAQMALKGKRTDAQQKRQEMMALAVKCARVVYAFGMAQNNHELAERVNFTHSKLRNMRKGKVVVACQNIKNDTAANIGALAGYGLVPGDVSALQTAIQEYEQKNVLPQVGLAERKTANGMLKKAMHEVLNVTLKLELDPLTEMLRTSNRDVYNAYRSVRQIIDRGVVHTKVTGTVRDEEGVALMEVRFTVCETGTQKVVREVMSDSNGVFKVTRMAVGTFDLKWEKNGYETKEEKGLHVSAGKVVRRRVGMRRG